MRKETRCRGVKYVPGRALQPYNVWFHRAIIWFAKTAAEGEEHLKTARLLKASDRAIRVKRGGHDPSAP